MDFKVLGRVHFRRRNFRQFLISCSIFTLPLLPVLCSPSTVDPIQRKPVPTATTGAEGARESPRGERRGILLIVLFPWTRQCWTPAGASSRRAATSEP